MTKTYRILVVDDEKSIRRFLNFGLRGQGYKVSLAASGTEAVEKVAEEKPDLIILDLGLPDMDGTKVIRQIRRVSAMPIIVLSVRSDEPAKVEAFDLGADD